MAVLWYDRKGNPVDDHARIEKLLGDLDYKRVGYHKTKINGETIEVSTVWLGLDHSFRGGPPVIFETMIFGGDYDEDTWRYCTEEEALEGHERIVDALKEGRDPSEV